MIKLPLIAAGNHLFSYLYISVGISLYLLHSLLLYPYYCFIMFIRKIRERMYCSALGTLSYLYHIRCNILWSLQLGGIHIGMATTFLQMVVHSALTISLVHLA